MILRILKTFKLKAIGYELWLANHKFGTSLVQPEQIAHCVTQYNKVLKIFSKPSKRLLGAKKYSTRVSLLELLF